MTNKEYTEYKDIKASLLEYCYKGVSVGKLAGFNVAYMVYFFSSMSILEKIKLAINFLFFIPDISFPDKRAEAVFGWSIKREDYKNLSDSYKAKMGKSFSDMCLSFEGCSKKLRVDFTALCFAAKLMMKFKNHGLKTKAIVFLSTYKSVSFLNHLEDVFHQDELKIYLSFNSSFDYESILTIFLRSKGVLTYSMQHGMYFKYENRIPFDIVNYENVAAKYLLVWGGYTQDQISDYLPENCEVVVFGHPQYEDRKNGFHDVNSNNVLVGLPRRLYEKEIVRLLDLLGSNAFKNYIFFIRPHPDNDKNILNDYAEGNENFVLSNESTLERELKGRGFLCFVGFNSTLLFEVSHYGLPVFQFITGNDEFLKAGFDEFISQDELLELLSVKAKVPPVVKAKGYFQ